MWNESEFVVPLTPKHNSLTKILITTFHFLTALRLSTVTAYLHITHHCCYFHRFLFFPSSRVCIGRWKLLHGFRDIFGYFSCPALTRQDVKKTLLSRLSQWPGVQHPLIAILPSWTWTPWNSSLYKFITTNLFINN